MLFVKADPAFRFFFFPHVLLSKQRQKLSGRRLKIIRPTGAVGVGAEPDVAHTGILSGLQELIIPLISVWSGVNTFPLTFLL